jgi:hypothetical protein
MTSNAAPTPALHIQLLHVPDCPLLDRVRETLRQCLHDTALTVAVEEIEGAHPSPTLLINGLDVTTGDPPGDQACCRLDLPTATQILDALRHAR